MERRDGGVIIAPIAIFTSLRVFCCRGKTHIGPCGASRKVCWFAHISMDTDWFLHDDSDYSLGLIALVPLVPY